MGATGVCSAALVIAGVLSSTAGGPRVQRSTPAARLALTGGTIYVNPTDGPIRDSALLIENGRITAVGPRGRLSVPAGTETLDCTGMTITAGFWNSHVHFLQRKWADAATRPAAELERQLQEMLTRYGFTSVFDTWSMWENTRALRDRIESGEIVGPRIRSTGEPMFGKISPPNPASWAALGFMPAEKFQTARVVDTSEALEATRKRLDAGVDGFKLYAVALNGVALPETAIQAAVKEAHRRGKPVFAHPTTAEGLLMSVRAGVDVLTHTTPQSDPWDEKVLAVMKLADVAVIPTLKLWEYEARHERVSVAEPFVKRGVSQLRAWHSAGGIVLFGTDVGYMSEYDPAAEYALMAEAGMDFRQILASLTTAPAARFAVSTQLGRIAPGFAADFTILNGDPSKDIRAFTAVQYALRDGKIIYRASAQR